MTNDADDTIDGTLNLVTCPRCGTETYQYKGRLVYGAQIYHWWCGFCNGWWRQIEGHQATWVDKWWEGLAANANPTVDEADRIVRGEAGT